MLMSPKFDDLHRQLQVVKVGSPEQQKTVDNFKKLLSELEGKVVGMDDWAVNTLREMQRAAH